MSIIPIRLQTHNDILKKIFSIPLIGGLIIILFGFLPNIIMAFPAEFMKLSDNTTLMIGSFLSIFWNLYLQKKGTKITPLFLPMWVWSIIVFITAVVGK